MPCLRLVQAGWWKRLRQTYRYAQDRALHFERSTHVYTEDQIDEWPTKAWPSSTQPSSRPRRHSR